MISTTCESPNRATRDCFEKHGYLDHLLHRTGHSFGVTGHEAPFLAIGYDRVTDGKLDATLVLIYPRPTTEDSGFIYLPTYRSVYRLTDAALPLGVDPGLHPTQLTSTSNTTKKP